MNTKSEITVLQPTELQMLVADMEKIDFHPSQRKRCTAAILFKPADWLGRHQGVCLVLVAVVVVIGGSL